MHRIGRTGRAKRQGHSIVLSTLTEQQFIEGIEELMQFKIKLLELPSQVKISEELIEEERPHLNEHYNPFKKRADKDLPGPAFHEKSMKNSKENRGGSYKFKIAKKYKKPKTRGDKNYNKRTKKRR